MLTIIIGIVLAVFFVFISLRTGRDTGGILACVSILIALILIASPISGYQEWELVKELELVTLSNDLSSGGTGAIYVSLSANNAYTYRYEIDSEFGTQTSKEYQTNTLSSKNVVEVEDPNCETAVIREYYREGKRSIWTFATFAEETKYVFYVPEGTISKEIKLK